MPAVRVSRRFHPYSTPEEVDYGIFAIPNNQFGEPPQMSQMYNALGSLEVANILSSPVTSYDVLYSTRPSNAMDICLRHKLDDHSRLRNAKNTISNVMERLKMLEQKVKENDDTILQWEVCERLTQGLNDYIKSSVLKSREPEFKRVTIIWSANSRFRYLPHIFTQWWIYWNAINPDAYELPSALACITEEEKYEILSRPILPKDVEDAAEILWDSGYQPFINLMLTFFHARPKMRNIIQHPRPSTNYAHLHIKYNFIVDPAIAMEVQYIIDEGKRIEGGKWVPLFEAE